MPKEEDIDFAALEAIANEASHIQSTPQAEVSSEIEEVFKKKNVLVADSWKDAYAKLPEPKVKFNHFCSMAIREKLEREGIITKETT